MFFLGYDASTKTDFTEKMQKILELPDFRAANPNLERVGNLLSQLKDGVSFLLEYPYNRSSLPKYVLFVSFVQVHGYGKELYKGTYI